MTTVGCFGKMPKAADFVRKGISSPTMREFEDWFHQAYTTLRGAGERGLRYRCVAILPSLRDNGLIAAVATPSRDRIGREFPMVIAVSLPSDYSADGSAPLSLGLSRFWNAASATFEANRESDPGLFQEAVQRLAAPSLAEVGDARHRWSELRANLGARQMEQECFGDPSDRFYAYHTLRLAVRDRPSGRVLACPAGANPAYRAFWIELTERSDPTSAPLPVLWLEGTEAPTGLMVALGKAPSSMLSFALGHNQRSAVLWPLTTTQEAAKKRSEDALSGGEWGAAEQNLGRLLDVLVSTRV